MRRLVGISIGTVLLVAVGGLHAQHSPYMGLEEREIKALSADQVAAYLAGDGMGFALPAELNYYPGPKHVLELATVLELSAEQQALTEKFYSEMRDKAQRLGREIVEREKHLDSLFARGEISVESLSTTVREISNLEGNLRVAHLQAHLGMKEILTDDQIALYSRHRGYGGGTGHPHGSIAPEPAQEEGEDKGGRP